MTSPVAELRRVSKSFGRDDAGTMALRGVDLVVRGGESLAVTGPSGAGKSTLLGILGLLQRPSAGEVWLDGSSVDIADARSMARRRASSVGFVFQSHHLLPARTCADNVLLGAVYSGRQRQLAGRATALLGAVGLGDRADDLAAQLSGGESQRVAICRALIGDPALLLCDEPTGNLDSRRRDDILALLLAERSGRRAVVIVTHDPVVADRCDRHVELVDGEIR